MDTVMKGADGRTYEHHDVTYVEADELGVTKEGHAVADTVRPTPATHATVTP